MKPDLFSIGPLTIHGYGLCIAIGILVAYYVTEQRAKRRNMSLDTVFSVAMRAGIFGILGAKLMFYIVEIKDIISNPKMLLDIANGYVVYGGIILGALASLIYCYRKKLVWGDWFDLFMPQIAIAQGFGRLGCLMAGCCYGAETDSAFHIVFKHSYLAPNNVWLYPTQIMSSALNFINFALLVFVAPKLLGKRQKKGQITALFLINYSIGRFALEFFRGDAERGAIGILSTSQFISCFIFVIGIVLFFTRREAMNLNSEVSTENVTESIIESVASEVDEDSH